MTQNFDTIEKQVKTEINNEYGYRNLTEDLSIEDLQSETTIVIPYNSFINKYRYFLEDYVEERELSNLEYLQFRQNPQFLSEALYGTIHFWHTLLELNNCISRTDFTMQKIKYYNQSKIMELINEIQLKNSQENEINI